jgi:hypothetical protein
MEGEGDPPDVYTYGDIYDALDVCDNLDIALARVRRQGLLSQDDEDRCKVLVEGVRRRLQTAMEPKPPPLWRRILGT